MAKILVWLKEPHAKAKHVWISPSEENLKKHLGGEWDTAVLASDLHILFNKDIVFSNLRFNCEIASQMFFGTIILTGADLTNCELTADTIRRIIPQLLKEG